jgi:3-oxoadipate enol-lactonase
MSVALHHTDEGPLDAPVLVLSGSLGATLEMWNPQVKELAKHFRVIRIDHRGHGGSPVPEGPYRIADMAGDALALLDQLEIARVAWCGLSMGGMVGMYLGSEAPQRLRSLSLFCTTAHFPDPSPWQERIALVAAGGTESIAHEVVARWFTPEWAAAHPDVIAEHRAMVAGTPDDGYIASCQAVRDWDHRSRLQSVAVRTLVVCGAADSATPIEPHARELAQGIPGARFEMLDGAHVLTVENADEATALIAEHAST